MIWYLILFLIVASVMVGLISNAMELDKKRKMERQRSKSQIDESTLSDCLDSAVGIDYRRLRNCLANGDLEEANKETGVIICKLINIENYNPESIVTFPGRDISCIPCTDFRTIDQLWTKYTDGHFGMSVQAEIWDQVWHEKEQFMKREGLNVDDDEVRVSLPASSDFRELVHWNNLVYQYSFDAPRGHLPRVFEESPFLIQAIESRVVICCKSDSRREDSALLLENKSVEAGIKFYNERKFREALKIFLYHAHKDDSIAQSYLGKIYYLSDSNLIDYDDAFKWFLLSAQQGNSDAQLNLGLMYAKGQGVSRDGREAIKWWTPLAEEGDIDAQVNLGVLYSGGFDGIVAPNIEESRRWFITASESGDTQAQIFLGALYLSGFDGVVDPNVEEAERWLKIASDKQNHEAQYLLADMYLDGKLSLKPENRERGVNLLLLSDLGNYPLASIRLASIFANSEPAKAIGYLRKAEKYGDEDIQQYARKMKENISNQL